MKKLKSSKVFSLFMSLIIATGLLQGNVYGKEDKMLFPAMERSSKGNLYGYINEKGTWVIKPEYERAYPFTEGIGVVNRDDLYGLVNGQGKEILAPTYQSITPFKDERAIFGAEEGEGVLDRQGKMITSKWYSYIEGYHDGVTVIGVTQKDGSSLYGYMDKQGKEIIIPSYLQAESFDDGKALVQGTDKKYQMIDQVGKVTATFDAAFAYGYSDDKIVFSQEIGGLQGYMDEQGKVVIAPIYQTASPFKDDVAVVSTSTYYRGEVGLIDEVGKYIYPNTYNDILYLGENRVALGKAINPEETFIGSIYAIGDTKGNILTDFMYYGVSEYEEGLASVYDEQNTYFVDLEGKRVRNLPVVPGSGTLTKAGDVIGADVDYVLSYYKTSGKAIYEINSMIKLGKEYSIQVEKYKPNRNYLVYEPQIEGMKNQEAQALLNKRLKELGQGQLIEDKEILEYTYYSDFEVNYYKNNLLVLKMISSTYPLGAAHPMPTTNTPVINLETGQLYNLEDLFKKDQDWKGTLHAILQEMATKEPLKDRLFKETKVEIRENQPFYVDDEALYIYYPPYEIGPYSSGFITFRIPYSAMDFVINKEGSLWQSIKE